MLKNIVILFASIAIVLFLIDCGVKSSHDSEKKVTLTCREETNKDSVLKNLDPRLLEMTKRLRIESPSAYEFSEGDSINGSCGKYIIAVNREEYLVWIMDITFFKKGKSHDMQAVTLLRTSRWKEETERASNYGLRTPSPRFFFPKDYIRVKDGKFKKKGFFAEN
jgi:hypothetical protein